MTDFDVVQYAKGLLGTVTSRPHNFTIPVPAGRLKAMCDYIVGNNQDLHVDGKPPLTETEKVAYQAVKQDIAIGRQPTVRSVQDRLGYKSPNSSKEVLDRLIKLGYLKREGSKKQIVLI